MTKRQDEFAGISLYEYYNNKILFRLLESENIEIPHPIKGGSG
jgi:hypothetical protein